MQFAQFEPQARPSAAQIVRRVKRLRYLTGLDFRHAGRYYWHRERAHMAAMHRTRRELGQY